ncbi:hypothetical protein CEXT_489681 [Caerostris extrusa]|uniref:Uncharacterized protein n=1 Tax=Caerostris extrusa TaxID=172846 RepID=A0AAV4M8K9_CAEEX|nr:hypothetical protein CEXT_489681 [Caerostris extrusa]
MLEHPPCFQDLAHCDFFIPSPKKYVLKEICFESLKTIKKKTSQTVGVCERKQSCSIAEVEVKMLEAHAEMMNDSSMLAQVFLIDVHLDDTRNTRKVASQD